MSGFALYRLPHTDVCTLIEGATQRLSTCSQLNGCRGFAVAPFAVSADEPIVVISSDSVTTLPVDDADKMQSPALPSAHAVATKASRESYAIDFANFHAQLLKGTFRKIVLARCVDETLPAELSPMELFQRACRRYPRLFIALVSTPESGLWLTATPEILLEGNSRQWRTIALAGTMRLEESQLQGEGEDACWSTKNIQEQRYVATYIAECLEHVTGDFREEGPRTVRAADLIHLRSDFTFTLPDSSRLGDLLARLHPTPAVCGLPKHDAFRFIVSNEHSPRRYYSGFMGPIDPDADTHLYVSLRCMAIDDAGCHLYAGGGLLPDSIEELEWQETEAKLDTMRQIIKDV